MSVFVWSVVVGGGGAAAGGGRGSLTGAAAVAPGGDRCGRVALVAPVAIDIGVVVGSGAGVDAGGWRDRDGSRAEANSVTTAPPSEWPTRSSGGRAGQCMADWVRRRMARRSEASVARVRSSAAPDASPPVVVVRPCPRASRDRMPADGRRFLTSALSTANERPDEPAPWWVTKSGPGGLPGPEEGAGEVR